MKHFFHYFLVLMIVISACDTLGQREDIRFDAKDGSDPL